MERKDIERKIMILNIVIVIGILAIVALATPLILAKFSPNEPQSINDILNACINKDLQSSSSCVIDQTQGFYKYNINNLGKQLNFSQLVSQGGVCSNWSQYYTELGQDLGFEAKNVIIPTSGDSYHEFSVWSDKSGYCIIDQTQAQCFSLAN